MAVHIFVVGVRVGSNGCMDIDVRVREEPILELENVDKHTV